MDLPTIRIGERDVRVYDLDLTTREDLVLAWGSAVELGQERRVWAAAIGLCTRIGREAKADYAKAGYSVLTYGGAVYRHLVDVLKLDLAGVKLVGVELLNRCAEGAFPTEGEVEEARGNSDGRAES